MRSGRGASPGFGAKTISTRSTPASGAEDAERIVAERVGLDLDRQAGLVEAEPLELRLHGLARTPCTPSSGPPRGPTADSADLGPGVAQRRLEGLRGAASSPSIAASLASISGSASRQFVGLAAEPGGEPPVEGQSSFDLVEPGRVVFPALAESAEGVGDLAGLVGQPIEVGRGVGEFGDRVGQRAELAGDRLQQPLGRAVGLVEQGEAVERGRADGLGVGQPMGLPGQVVDARRVGGRRRPARRVRRSSKARSRSRAWESRRRAVFRRRGGRRGRLAGSRYVVEEGLDGAEGVEQAPLAVGVEEGPALVLAVDVDQPLSEGLERGDGHGQAVGVRGGPALSGDPTGEDQLVVVDRAAEDGFEVGAEIRVGHVEDGGGPALVLAGRGRGRPRPCRRGRGRGR